VIADLMTAGLVLTGLLAAPAAAADAPAADAPAAAAPAAAAPAADAPAAETPAPPERVGSFGKALDNLGPAVTWSAYADLIARYLPPEPFTFDATHFNPILAARLRPDLWAELEIEFESGGSVARLEYGFLEYQPRPEIGLTVGQFLVPIGAFNDELHPSFRWPMVSRPLMFEDVMPAVWFDVGVRIMGTLGQQTRLVYSLYAINGLGGTWSPGTASPVRALRGQVLDNNTDKGLGLRLALHPPPVGSLGHTEVGFSAYTNALQDDGTQRLVILDVHAGLVLGALRLSTEAATSRVGAGLAGGDWASSGIYVQPSAVFGRIEPALRWEALSGDDLATSTETGGASGSATLVQAVAASTKVRLFPFWNLRAEGRIHLDGTVPEAQLMSAFFF